MQLSPLSETPGVSYIMPILNEELYLRDSVMTVLAQQYEGEKEVILALGPSSDRTNHIAAELAAHDPRIRTVENKQRDIPIGLNLAIAASTHEIIIRVDAHSELTPDYTSNSINSLRAHAAANVGGVMKAEGKTSAQRAIAAAYNSPFGLGGGTYHGDAVAGPAESAYLGVFRKEAIHAVGGFDESIRRGEDWELNLRIRRAHGVVWFDPKLKVTYWPRATFSDLAKQFFATGAWRAVLVRKYPSETPWRFFAPPTLVLVLVVNTLLFIMSVMRVFPLWWPILTIAPVAYLIGLAYASSTLRGVRGFRERLYGFASLATMHLCWGTGFLTGLLRGAQNTVDRSRM